MRQVNPLSTMRRRSLAMGSMNNFARPVVAQLSEVVLFACALALMLPPINWHPRLGISVMLQIVVPSVLFAISQIIATYRGKTLPWVALLNTICFVAFGWELARSLAAHVAA